MASDDGGMRLIDSKWLPDEDVARSRILVEVPIRTTVRRAAGVVRGRSILDTGVGGSRRACIPHRVVSIGAGNCYSREEDGRKAPMQSTHPHMVSCVSLRRKRRG